MYFPHGSSYLLDIMKINLSNLSNLSTLVIKWLMLIESGTYNVQGRYIGCCKVLLCKVNVSATARSDQVMFKIHILRN